jgi:hypothetical protein
MASTLVPFQHGRASSPETETRLPSWFGQVGPSCDPRQALNMPNYCGKLPRTPIASAGARVAVGCRNDAPLPVTMDCSGYRQQLQNRRCQRTDSRVARSTSPTSTGATQRRLVMRNLLGIVLLAAVGLWTCSAQATLLTAAIGVQSGKNYSLVACWTGRPDGYRPDGCRLGWHRRCEAYPQRKQCWCHICGGNPRNR